MLRRKPELKVEYGLASPLAQYDTVRDGVGSHMDGPRLRR